jgi:folate-dependent tRNA-U54 methylase TrmFO/GidA
MTSYYPLDKLRKIPGLENAKFVDPYSGGKGNSIRYLSVAPVSDDLKVNNVENLFCAGEKSGLFVGHTEAICTGSLAGHNAVRYALKMPTLVLPKDTVIGDIINYANYKIRTKEGRKNRYTFAGSEYFERMKKAGLYTINSLDIKNKISSLGLSNIFNKNLI